MDGQISAYFWAWDNYINPSDWARFLRKASKQQPNEMIADLKKLQGIGAFGMIESANCLKVHEVIKNLADAGYGGDILELVVAHPPQTQKEILILSDAKSVLVEHGLGARIEAIESFWGPAPAPWRSARKQVQTYGKLRAGFGTH